MSPTILAEAFVGRRSELSALQARLERALAGQGGLIAVTGEPGAGKSSLVNRFVSDAVLARPELRVINTYCSEQYGADEPYQPFMNAFSELVADGQKPRRMSELAREIAPHWLQAVPIAGDLMAAAVATAVELRRKRRNGDGESGQSLRELAAQLAPHWLGAIPVAGDLIAAAHSTALELKGTLARTDARVTRQRRSPVLSVHRAVSQRGQAPPDSTDHRGRALGRPSFGALLNHLTVR
jgi:predicted ATPase